MKYIPKIHNTVSPPSKLTAPSIPSESNIGLAYKMAPAANAALANPFAANRDPEYCAYVNGK